MKILFFGCDDFAQKCLERLIEDGHTIKALITQPDRPKGRGLQMACSPTKALALKHHIEVFQPTHLKDVQVVEHIKNYQADVFVVVAYGHLLPNEILQLPKYLCINVHPSLLPKYRGAAPINWPLINGDDQTGVTLIRINASMDAGDILAQEIYPLSKEINAQELRNCLADMGARMLSAFLPCVESGQFSCVKQDVTQVTKAPKLHKELGQITWDMPALKIHHLVRGTYPWPGAYIFFEGMMLKVLETEVVECCHQQKNPLGAVVDITSKGLMVQTAKDILLIKKVHLASSKPMDARSFAVGRKIKKNDVIGK